MGSTTSIHLQNYTPFSANILSLGNTCRKKFDLNPDTSLSIPLIELESYTKFILELRSSTNGTLLKSVIFPLKAQSAWIIGLDGVGEQIWLGKSGGGWGVNYAVPFYKWNKDYDHTHIIDQLKMIKIKPKSGVIIQPYGAPTKPANLDDMWDQIVNHSKIILGDDEDLRKQVVSELKDALSKTPPEFPNAFSSADICYKALSLLATFAMEHSSTTEATTVCFTVCNEVMLIYEGMKGKTFNKFKADDAKTQNGEKRILDMIKERAANPDFMKDAPDLASTFAEVSKQLVQVLIDNCNFPKTEASVGVYLYFIQDGPKRKPLYNRKDDSKFFLDICTQLFTVDIAAKEVSQRERELILSLLTATVVKDVKVEDLNGFIAKMIKIQSREGKSADNMNEEDKGYHQEKGSLPFLVIAALEQSIYSLDKLIPVDCIGFMSEYPEKFLSGEMLSYCLNILDKSTDKETDYVARICTAFAATKDKKKIFQTEQTMSSIISLFTKRTHPADSIYGHLIDTVKNGTGFLKLNTKDHVPKLVECLKSVLEADKINYTINTLQLIRTCAATEQNFLERDGMTGFSKEIIGLLKTHLEKKKDAMEKESIVDFFTTFSSVIRLKGAPVHFDTIKIMLDMEKGLKDDGNEKKSVLATVEMALEYTEGDDKDPEKWGTYLGDPTFDQQGHLQASILRYVPIAPPRIETLVKTELTKFNFDGQKAILRGLSAIKPFPRPAIPAVIEFMKPKSSTNPENINIIPECLSVVRSWLKNKETTGKVADELNVLFKTVKENNWIFDESFEQIFQICDTIITLEQSKTIEVTEGEVGYFLDYITQALESEQDESPASFATKLLLNILPNVPEDKKANIKELIERRADISGDPAVQKNILSLVITEKSWVTLTLEKVTPFLAKTGFDPAIAASLVNLLVEKDPEHVAMELVDYIGKSEKMEKDVQSMISKIVETSTNIMVLREALSFVDGMIKTGFPGIEPDWISKLFDSLIKKQAVKDGKIELLDTIIPLVLTIELHYGFDDKIWSTWIELLTKVQLSAYEKRYMDWITTAQNERLKGGVKTSIVDYSSSWIAKWGRADRQGLIHISYHLPSIKGIQLGTKLKMYCMAADMTFVKTKSNDVEDDPEQLYFRALALLDEATSTSHKDNWKLTSEELKGLKGKLKDDSLSTFSELITLLGKYYVLLQKYDDATNILKSLDDATNFNKEIDQLKEIQKKDVNDFSKVSKDDDLLSKHLFEADAKNGVAIMKKLIVECGLDNFGEGKINLCKLALSIPKGKIDTSILSGTLAYDWPKELVHSYILKSFEESKDLTKETVKTEFGQLWNEFVSRHLPLRYNSSNLKEDVDFLTKLKGKLDSIFTSKFAVEKINLFFFLLHNQETYDFFDNEKDKSPPSLEVLQSTWVNKILGSGLDEKIVTQFWTKLQEIGYLNGEAIGFKAVEMLITSISSEEFKNTPSLLNLLKELEFPSQNFAIVLPSHDGPNTKQSIADITQRVQNYYMKQTIQEFSRKYFHFVKEENKNLDKVCIKLLHLLNSKERKGWEFINLKKLLDLVLTKFKSSDKEGKAQDRIVYALSGVLNHFGSYDFETKSVTEVLSKLEDKDTVVKDWIQHLPPLPHPEAGKELDLDELGKRITKDNGDKVNVDDIKKEFNSLDAMEMNKWEAAKIADWAKKQMSNDKPIKSETICVLRRAAELFLGTKPRPAQIISLYTIIQSAENDKGSGRLAKIETGEGKTIIIAMLAAYICLNKKVKVDIVTTTSLLAARDSDKNKKFFDGLGITSTFLKQGSNNDTYKNQIIYGDASSFQADSLRQDFHFEDVRGDRKFAFCIVDEVDSMLIDQASYSTKLVDRIPGFEHLEVVYTAIWKHVNEVENLFLPLGPNQEIYSVNQTVGIDPDDLVGLLAKVIAKNGTGSQEVLSSRIRTFCEKNKNREKGDPEIKKYLKDLWEKGTLPRPDSGIGDISAGDLDKLIDQRWNFSPKTDAINCRKICEKVLGHKILVMTVTDDGFAPSLNYHSPPDKDKNDIPAYFQTMYLFYFNNQLMHLIPVSASSVQMQQKVSTTIKNLVVASTDKSVEAEKRLVIPNHFKEFFDLKLMSWIKSAITARYHMDKNQAYIVKTGEKEGERSLIVPVDTEHTGALEEDAVWPDGLHQFLQLKHKLAFTPERISTNFMSNLTFFNKYGGKVFGLTGTLGSVAESGMLEKAYAVDSIHLPPFQEKRHIYLQDLTFSSESEWSTAILNTVHTITQQQRAILVICKTIDDVNSLETYLTAALSEVDEIPNIQKYTRPDVDKEKNVPLNDIIPGSIVLATNLAGRGTDFSIDQKVEDNGGLHVCITFLPQNLRVEEQGRGRTSRNGKPGSSQLIICNEDVAKHGWEVWTATDELKKLTKQVEEEALVYVTDVTIPNIHFQDKLFSDYCEKRKKLSDAKKDDVNKDNFIKALDERWGFLLDQNKPKWDSGKKEKVDPKSVSLDVLDNGGDLSEIKNAQYHTLMGNVYIEKDKYSDAIPHYDKAIELDKTFSGTGLYYRAYATINDFKDDYKKKAIADLDATFTLLKDLYHPTILSCGHYAQSVKDVDETHADGKDYEYMVQITGKLHLLNLWAKSIGTAKDMLNSSSEMKAKLVKVEKYVEDNKDKDAIISDSEIQEMKDAGIVYFLEIEKRPAPWWAIFTVIIVGVVEAVAGLALMAFSGGALGEAFLIDGVLDIANGIEAAITGEYISLAEFFKQKGINAAIMIASFGVGAILSKVATVLKGTRFIQLLSKGKELFAAAGKLPPFSWAGKLTRIVKTGLFKLGSFISEKSQFVLKKAKEFGTWIWGGVKAVGRGIKSAYEFVISKWRDAEELVEEGAERSVRAAELEEESTELARSTRLTNENLRGTQFKNLGKILGKEMARRAVMKGLDFVLQNQLEPQITKLIKGAIKNKVDEKVKEKMASDSILKPITKFIQEAQTASNYSAKKDELNATLTQDADQALLINNTAIQTMLQVVDEFCSEAKRTLVNTREQEGARATLGWIIEKFGTAVFEITTFSVMIKELVTTMDDLFNTFITHIEGKTDDGQPDEIPKESFIYSKEGKSLFDEDLKKLSGNIADLVTDQLVAIIVQGLFRPHIDIGLNALSKKMKIFKTDHLIEDLGRIQEARGNPERFPNASIWDMYKKNTHARDEIKEEESAYARRKARENRLLSAISESELIELTVYTYPNYGTFTTPENTELQVETVFGRGGSHQVGIAYNSALNEYYPVIRQLDGTNRAVPFDSQTAAQNELNSDAYVNSLVPSIVVSDKGRFEDKMKNIQGLLDRLYFEEKTA